MTSTGPGSETPQTPRDPIQVSRKDDSRLGLALVSLIRVFPSLEPPPVCLPSFALYIVDISVPLPLFLLLRVFPNQHWQIQPSASTTPIAQRSPKP